MSRKDNGLKGMLILGLGLIVVLIIIEGSYPLLAIAAIAGASMLGPV
jgi:hypothetical protein